MGSNYKDELLKIIEKSQLPPALGGTCNKCQGGCIPEAGKFPDLSHLRGKEFVSENSDEEYNISCFFFEISEE
jgi:hypothetical protein